jgi:hypothetical protein
MGCASTMEIIFREVLIITIDRIFMEMASTAHSLFLSLFKPIARSATAIAELWEESNNDLKIYDIAQNVAG